MSGFSKRILTRREAVLLSATAGIGMVTSKPALASDSIKTPAHQEPGNVSTPRSTVAKTQYGKVRGFVDGGVLTFKGVPYGATTAEKNRWLLAKPPKPWTDEYPALAYGANCAVGVELPFESCVNDQHLRQGGPPPQVSYGRIAGGGCAPSLRRNDRRGQSSTNFGLLIVGRACLHFRSLAVS